MKSGLPIGIFDSGIGGLSVYSQIKKVLPKEDIIYFGDTAHAPYGTRNPWQIREFVNQMLSFFDRCNLKIAVSACNTITVLGLEEFQKNHDFKIVGMSTGAQQAIAASTNKRIGVIGTEVTIHSGMHHKTLLALKPESKVYAQTCPKFAPLIEQGKLTGIEIEDAITEYLTPLKKEKIDTLLLACTHYPYISELIKEFMGDQVKVIDPAEETANQIRNVLSNAGILNDNGNAGKGRLYFSEQAQQVRRIAENIMDTSRCLFLERNLEGVVPCKKDN
ncbi:glutamate racemase [Pelosinus fermentans]|uniref:Glutamate racemase n=1 Tax=Pelosinus fermentans JBW45 TaxID=1192197 RepID=I8TX52_9FIRM|nr:glutamate racemase [Pelosinus fermentans]AJQ26286.1 Glutamate racemase [Pelosinus fermentans JBW45]